MGQGGATEEHGAHIGYVLRVELRYVELGQGFTVGEHGAHPGYVLRVELRYVELGQGGAVIEHGAHIGYVLRVELRYVELGQGGAVKEHPAHIGYLLRVEFRYVELGQSFALVEHGVHIGYLRGIEMLYARDLRQSLELIKPTGCRFGSEILKRWVNHSLGSSCVRALIYACPSRNGSTFVLFLDSPFGARACRFLCVVIEGEGFSVVGLHDIGFPIIICFLREIACIGVSHRYVCLAFIVRDRALEFGASGKHFI